MHIIFDNIPVHLAEFERNVTKRNCYYVAEFMSKRNFLF